MIVIQKPNTNKRSNYNSVIFPSTITRDVQRRQHKTIRTMFHMHNTDTTNQGHKKRPGGKSQKKIQQRTTGKDDGAADRGKTKNQGHKTREKKVPPPPGPHSAFEQEAYRRNFRSALLRGVPTSVLHYPAEKQAVKQRPGPDT